MYEKVATVTVSIEETVSLGQGERGSDIGFNVFCYFQLSKVEAEILKFQREIEKATSEKNRVREWQLRQRRNSHSATPSGSKARLGSMDSLLSGDSDYSSGRSMQQHQLNASGALMPPPPLPPKGKYISSDNLSPPKLPPKKKIHNNSAGSNSLKRVSISMQEVNIVGKSKTGSEMNLADDEDSHESLEGDEDDDEEVVQDPGEESSDDSLATLPSVRELASKFMPKKSPEPVVKKAVNHKVRLVIIFLPSPIQLKLADIRF